VNLVPPALRQDTDVMLSFWLLVASLYFHLYHVYVVVVMAHLSRILFLGTPEVPSPEKCGFFSLRKCYILCCIFVRCRTKFFSLLVIGALYTGVNSAAAWNFFRVWRGHSSMSPSVDVSSCQCHMLFVSMT